MLAANSLPFSPSAFGFELGFSMVISISAVEETISPETVSAKL